MLIDAKTFQRGIMTGTRLGDAAFCIALLSFFLTVIFSHDVFWAGVFASATAVLGIAAFMVIFRPLKDSDR